MEDWFTKHSKELSLKYPGRHIAIVGNKVVSVGRIPSVIFKDAKKKYPKKKVSLAYIPTDEETATLL